MRSSTDPEESRVDAQPRGEPNRKQFIDTFSLTSSACPLGRHRQKNTKMAACLDGSAVDTGNPISLRMKPDFFPPGDFINFCPDLSKFLTGEWNDSDEGKQKEKKNEKGPKKKDVCGVYDNKIIIIMVHYPRGRACHSI